MSAEATRELHQKDDQTSGFFRSFLLPLTALVLALCGQWQLLTFDNNPLPGAFLFGAAILVYLASLVNWPPAELRPERIQSIEFHRRPILRNEKWRAAVVIFALILAAVSYGRFANNALDGGFWPWLCSILLFLLAFLRVPACSFNELSAALATWWRHLDKRVLLLLTAILMLALFFRFYRLQDVPLEMTSDHAEKILDVQDVLDGSRPIFFPRNTGRELFQFYLTAGLIRLTGLANGHLALKVGTAIFGFVAVPFTFLLGRFLYGSVVGLLAAFFLAISHWHVAITRVGLRFPFIAAFVAPLLFFLLRALRENHRNDWLLSGFFLGVGLHTYTAMRMAPVLCAALVGMKLLFDGTRKLSRKQARGVDSWTRAFWTNGVLALCFTLLLLLPLIRYTFEDPQGVWIRSLSRATSDTEPSLTELAGQFLENSANALLMFNVRGDVVPMNTIPGEPQLGLVSGAMLILGLAYLLWRLLKRDVRSLILFAGLFFLLLPSILSLAFPAENPSAVRTGGAIPVVMIIVAIPLATIGMRLWSSPLSVGQPVAAAALLLLIGAAIASNYIWYFRAYDEHIRHSIWNTTELGAVLKSFEVEGADVNNAFHVPYPHWVDTRNIGINAGHVRWDNVVTDQAVLASHMNGDRPRLYFVHPSDMEMLQSLLSLFPEGIVEHYDSLRQGRDFVIFRVPADT